MLKIRKYLKILPIGNIIKRPSRRLFNVELEKIDIYGLNDIYALSVVQKEFKNAVNEQWKKILRGKGIKKN